MQAKEIRKKYLSFFEQKGHKIIPSASLIPENDPTTLFTGSGMQPLVSYLAGQIHPLGKRLTNSQICFRSEDIEEVGDNRHTTFFEMLGNWSLGDYFKKEQLAWFFQFLTKDIGIDPAHLYTTVFMGNETVSKDEESIFIWQELFKTDLPAKDGASGFDKAVKIYTYPAKKNWWSRAGVPENMPPNEIGGPDSEMFFDFDSEDKLNVHQNSPFRDEICHVNCDCGRFLEIGNSVFMEYRKNETGIFDKLSQHNVDFGGGLERITAASQKVADIFQSDLFLPLIAKIEEITSRSYQANKKEMRVIADHLKAATFILGEDLAPSNVGRGYFLRRLIRRATRYGKTLGIKKVFSSEVAEAVMAIYQDVYPWLRERKDFIFSELCKEEEKFNKTLDRGLKELEKISASEDGFISGVVASTMYQTYGFPIEMTRELASEKGMKVDEQGFKEEMRKHQELSRTASAGQFKAGLADSSEATTKYHTATHLLLAALRAVLKQPIEQRGSNITAERIRFDFGFERKLTQEEIRQVGDWVNQKIKEELEVVCQEMPLEKAIEKGAMANFREKYPEIVKVYTVCRDFQDKEGFASCEICSGPHIKNTKELGKFKIIREEASSQGVRRVKAVLTP